MSSSSSNNNNNMDEEQKKRYDRQVRVWGAEAQSRIQTSRVLIVGLRGINVEVAKNIILAGVNVVIQDAATVSVRDLSSNFFLTAADVGAPTVEAALPRIQQLNTYASVTAETRPLHQLGDDFFRDFSVVVVHDCSEVRARRCNGKPFSSFFFPTPPFYLSPPPLSI